MNFDTLTPRVCKPNFCHTLQNQPILTITLLIPIHHRLTRACPKICNKMHHWTPRLTILRQRCGLSRKRRERSWRAHSARCATKISSSGASLLTRARGCDQQKKPALQPLPGQDPVDQRVQFAELFKLKRLPGFCKIPADALYKVWSCKLAVIILGEFRSKQVIST